MRQPERRCPRDQRVLEPLGVDLEDGRPVRGRWRCGFCRRAYVAPVVERGHGRRVCRGHGRQSAPR